MPEQHSTHFKDVCEYGYVHGQCRCATPGKYERKVKCDQPIKHKPIRLSSTVPKPPPPPLKPKALRSPRRSKS